MTGRRTRLTVARRRGVQSVDIAISILNVFTRSDRALPLKAISEAVGMASSNVHRYLASFVQSGLLRQHLVTGLYDLGPLALQVGLAALNRLDIVELAAPEMRQLSSRHGVMVLLSVFSFHGPTVVRLQQCSPPIVTSVTLGSLLPMRSATGRAFLAFLPPELTQHVMDAEFQQSSPRSAAVQTLHQLRAGVAQTRKGYYATVGIDVLPGLHAVASPILNFHGEAIAVLSITGQDEQLGTENHPALVDLIRTARQLAQEAGHKDVPEPMTSATAMQTPEK